MWFTVEDNFNFISYYVLCKKYKTPRDIVFKLVYRNKYINLWRIIDLENDIIHFNTDNCACVFVHFNSSYHLDLCRVLEVSFEMQMNVCKCVYIKSFDAVPYRCRIFIPNSKYLHYFRADRLHQAHMQFAMRQRIDRALKQQLECTQFDAVIFKWSNALYWFV